MINKKLLYVVVLLPAILMAWGMDSYIATSASDAFPASYDLTIPTDTLMYAAYMYTSTTDSLPYVAIYVSMDTGKTWAYVSSFYLWNDTSRVANEVGLDYVTDSLLVFFPSKYNKALYTVKITPSGGYTVGGTCNFSDLDTIFDIKAQNVYVNGGYHFYGAAIGKSGDTTILEINRSDDNGDTWTNIIRRSITTSTDLELGLLDFTASVKGGDTVRLVYAESYHLTSSGSYAVYGELWEDVISQTPRLVHGLTNLRTTDSYPEAAVDILGDMIVWAIVDSNSLYFVWTTDNLATLDSMEYLYNGDFEKIMGIDMVRWSAIWTGGFNLSFVGTSASGSRVWYQEITASGDSITFNSAPGIVSDTSIYTYVFNFSPYYKPRIKNWANLLTPAIMWHFDYSHLFGSPPFPIYDSTRFYLDYMAYTGIKEVQRSKPTLIADVRGNLLKVSLPGIEGKARLSIMDIAGRVVKNTVVTVRSNTATMDISSLKSGIYFITAENRNTILKGKFIKLE